MSQGKTTLTEPINPEQPILALALLAQDIRDEELLGYPKRETFQAYTNRLNRRISRQQELCNLAADAFRFGLQVGLDFKLLEERLPAVVDACNDLMDYASGQERYADEQDAESQKDLTSDGAIGGEMAAKLTAVAIAVEGLLRVSLAGDVLDNHRPPGRDSGESNKAAVSNSVPAVSPDGVVMETNAGTGPDDRAGDAAREAPWPKCMSSNDLADRLHLPRNATRAKLYRLAKKYPDFAIDNEAPRRGESKRLYRTAEVLPFLR